MLVQATKSNITATQSQKFIHEKDKGFHTFILNTRTYTKNNILENRFLQKNSLKPISKFYVKKFCSNILQFEQKNFNRKFGVIVSSYRLLLR